MNNKFKKTICLLSTYFLLFTVNSEAEQGKDDIKPYATYSKGKIYIADEDTIKRIVEDSDDLYIIDYRNDDNPDMQVLDSYKIRSITDINRVVDVLLKYEEEYPSPWERTRFSLVQEWLEHNILNSAGIAEESTRNVDFDNAEECFLTRAKRLRRKISK